MRSTGARKVPQSRYGKLTCAKKTHYSIFLKTFGCQEKMSYIYYYSKSSNAKKDFDIDNFIETAGAKKSALWKILMCQKKLINRFSWKPPKCQENIPYYYLQSESPGAKKDFDTI